MVICIDGFKKIKKILALVAGLVDKPETTIFGHKTLYKKKQIFSVC